MLIKKLTLDETVVKLRLVTITSLTLTMIAVVKITTL